MTYSRLILSGILSIAIAGTPLKASADDNIPEAPIETPDEKPEVTPEEIGGYRSIVLDTKIFNEPLLLTMRNFKISNSGQYLIISSEYMQLMIVPEDLIGWHHSADYVGAPVTPPDPELPPGPGDDFNVGVQTVGLDMVRIFETDRGVTLENLPAEAAVQAFNLSGLYLGNYDASQGRVDIEIDKEANRIIVVIVNGKSFKLQLRR